MLTWLALSVVCFLAALALDVADVWHKIAVEKRQAHRAAQMSVLMYVIGCIGFFSILTYSYWLIVPEIFGLYTGSILAFRREKT